MAVIDAGSSAGGDGPATADQDSVIALGGTPMHPRADQRWPWWYMFPATRTFVDAAGSRRRRHLHPTALQRAVARTVRDLGIAKHVNCHAFRHSFAAHLLATGCDIPTGQQLLGHRRRAKRL